MYLSYHIKDRTLQLNHLHSNTHIVIYTTLKECLLQSGIYLSKWVNSGAWTGGGGKREGAGPGQKCKLHSIIITLQEEKRIRNFISMQTLKISLKIWKRFIE